MMVSLPFKPAALRDGRRVGPGDQVPRRVVRRGLAMTDTAIIEIALKTMLVALKSVGADPGDLARHRLHDLALPVDDADPGVHAVLRPQVWWASASRCSSAATGCCTP
nr:hypothetical protein [Nocardioides convexus]